MLCSSVTGISCVVCIWMLFLFKDWFGDNNTMLFPKIRCSLSVLSINLSAETYAKFLRDDSVTELAQAGIYKGADNIVEYIKFAFPDTSPYFLTSVTNKQSIRFLRYENGQCEFLSLVTGTYTMNPNTTDNPPPFDYVLMLKAYLKFEEQYLSRINVYYTDEFLRLLFDKILASIPTRNYICSVMEGPCASILQADGGSNSSCFTRLSDIPSTDGITSSYVDGFSQSCRALHASFARINPNLHCPHLSFTPMEDRSGNIKCQTSKQKSPSDLFTEYELHEFEIFAESAGIDSSEGHTYIE